MLAYQAGIAKFEGTETQVFGISTDNVPSLNAFAEKLSLTFPLLSDFSKREVARAYGVLMPERGFANRATFRTCRAAWEQAAIDPDGTVHVVDYAGAPLGNLLDAPLLALWNTAPALAARTRALAASTPERRRRCIASSS